LKEPEHRDRHLARPPGTRQCAGLVRQMGRGCIVTDAEARHCWAGDEVPVLMYHRIADDGPEALAPYRVRVAEFERQLAWLQGREYRGMTLEQLYRWLFERKLESVEGKPIVLTFDDAYVDFYEHAYALLRHYGFPATVFVPTAHVGQVAEWDIEHGRVAEIMSWDQIVELSVAGVQFGSHSRSHRRMTELTPDEVLDDAIASKTELTQRLGVEIAGYCYPFGAANRTIIELIRRAGYRFAVLGLRGERAAYTDPLQLPRLEVLGTDSIDDFAGKLPQPNPASEEQRAAYVELRSHRDRHT
jgi:peptidoglycan/xylan/chitin deacetylase (PgdA/CDA1 family)